MKKSKTPDASMPEFLILISDAAAKAPKLHGFADRADLEAMLTDVMNDAEHMTRKISVYGLTPIVVTRKVEIEGLPRQKRRSKAAA